MDIFVKAIEERAACDDLVKRYILIRRKVFNLYKAWKKFEEDRLKLKFTLDNFLLDKE